MKHTFKNALTFVAAAGLFVSIGFSAIAAERISARISEPVMFNGETYPAGMIQIKEIQPYSPGTTLNKVRVGGEPAGMFIARTVEGAPQADRPSLVFSRNAQGTLVLEGMSMGNEPKRHFMALPSVDGHGERSTPRQAARLRAPALTASVR